LPPIHVDHHDLLTELWWRRVTAHRRRLLDKWHVKLVDEDFDGYLSASRTKLRQDVRCNVAIADHVVELETIEFVLDLANFQTVGIHVLLVTIPRFVDLVDDHYGVTVD
jgi:hypothetical protein